MCHQKPSRHPETEDDKLESNVHLYRKLGGCGFFAYSWKLPACSGAFYLQLTILAFLLTIGVFLLTALASLLTIGAFLLTMESVSNKGLKGLQAKKLNCKQKSSNCK